MSEGPGPNLGYDANGKPLGLTDDEQVRANGAPGKVPFLEEIARAAEEEREAGCVKLSPNDEFEYLYCSFEIDYARVRAEELPYTAYLEYMHMEEVYAQCNPPNSKNEARMAALRDVAQRYAEANKLQHKTTIKNIKAENLVKA